MRRGGFRREGSDQPDKKEVPITPVMRVLHPMSRVVMGLAFVIGGLSALWTWDGRYAISAVFVMIGALIVGPWVWPHEKILVEYKEVPGLEGPNSGGPE
jgi:hypothetical protein